MNTAQRTVLIVALFLMFFAAIYVPNVYISNSGSSIGSVSYLFIFSDEKTSFSAFGDYVTRFDIVLFELAFIAMITGTGYLLAGGLKKKDGE